MTTWVTKFAIEDIGKLLGCQDGETIAQAIERIQAREQKLSDLLREVQTHHCPPPGWFDRAKELIGEAPYEEAVHGK